MLHRGYQPVDYLLLLLLSAIWGSSFLFIKLAVVAIPPMTLVAARLGLAALALLLFLAATGRRLPRDGGIWRRFLLVGVAGNVVPFFLINWGEVTVDSSLAAILLAANPLATILLAHAFTSDERLTPLKGLGVIVGFGGIVVLVGPDALTGIGRDVMSQIAIVGAACCYAVTTIFVRRSRLIELPPAVNATGVLLSAAVIALPLALVIDRPWELPAPSTGALLSVVVLALLCTSAAFLILYRLLTTTGATFVSLLNYLAPVFGVFWGALLLGESLDLETLGALGLIMIGLGLTQARGRREADTAGS
ncbi:MAG: DMT family transporter [Alphaproteobacteria bacterium]